MKNFLKETPPFTKIYTWWWNTGVGYQKATELARKDWQAINNKLKKVKKAKKDSDRAVFGE